MSTPVSLSEWRARLSESGLSGYVLPAGYFSLLSLLVCFPLLEPGYVLSLDMIFAPNADYLGFGLGTKGPLYYGRLPFLLVLDGLALVVDDWVIQKLILLALPVLCGLSMYAACDTRTRTAALFAGTLYAVNPFVSVRLLAGHWYFLLGYAFVPLAVVAFDRYVAGEKEGSLAHAVGWTTLVSVFDPHATVLVALAGGCLWFVRTVGSVRDNRATTATAATTATTSATTLARRFGRFCLVAAAVNAYWLFPALAATVGGGTQLTTIDGADLTVFSARGTVADNVPLSVAMLYGFWRGAATTTVDLLSLPAVLALLAVLLYLAVSGALRRWADPTVRGVTLACIVAFVLSLGVSTPLSDPLFRTLTELVPPLRGMRDSQKFAGLLVFGYAFLGCRGVDALVSTDRQPVRRFVDSSRSVDRRTLARVALVALVLLTPLAYTAPMVTGFDGQLDSTTYPESWHAANDHLVAESGDDEGRVLFLPWHGYLTFSWTERRVATPAPLFFERPVVAGHNIEVGGIETRATDPTHARVRATLADPSEPTFGDDLAAVGIEHVVLAHEADYRQYAELAGHEDFAVAFADEGITVYENEAYESADAPWPRAGPPVPTGALAVGVGVTVVSVTVLGRRVGRRRRG
ncbi:hypothetical protein SAMN04487949_2964 [Halogranum gelatinilyticum]|uniref:Membrane protein YfhO n=1 Tax=Halogranum gelatinilyticum TaxID=660521 RepID=A0A1G9XFJ4_9EURY|nr:hypothetical protein [Halogranum gelatinilyticum]SDM95311.1 hypothetical protein SAMN04487949_2964 [Halogranum gelatinilyticum]